MKLYYLLIVVLLLWVFTPFVCVAQDKANNISTNLLGHIGNAVYKEMGSLDIQFERKVSLDKSFVIGAEYFNFDGGSHVDFGGGFIESYFKGIIFTAEYRHYFSKKLEKINKGFLMGLYIRSAIVNETYIEHSVRMDIEFSENHNVTGFGLDFGFTFGENKLTLTPLVGAALCINNDQRTNPHIDPTFHYPIAQSYIARFQLSLGYSF
jgi:hypothetical protein